MSITVRAAAVRSTTMEITAVRVSTNRLSPPSTMSRDPVREYTSAGPSAAYSPPCAQTANSTGVATSTGPRSVRGSRISGRSEASAPGVRLTVSRMQDDAGGLEHEHAHQGQVDQVRGGGQVAHRQGGQQHAGPGAHARGDRVSERAALAVHVQQARADRAERRAGGQALHDPGDQQLGHPAGGGEHQQRGGLHGDRGQQHRTPSDVVGELAQGQQRGEHRHRVHPEHDRGGDRREAPASLVDRVQRRGGGGRGQQRHDQRRQQVQRRAPAQPPPSGRGRPGRTGLGRRTAGQRGAGPS